MNFTQVKILRDLPVYSNCSGDPLDVKIHLKAGTWVHLDDRVPQRRIVCKRGGPKKTLRKTVTGWLLTAEEQTSFIESLFPDCPICLCDADPKEFVMPCCKKPMHAACFEMQLKSKWTGKMINFGFTKCPLCRADTMGLNSHWNKNIRDQFSEIKELKKNIEFLTERQDGEVPAEERGGWAFFECTKCEKPFCGGKVSCAEEHDLDAQEMICGECKWQAQAQDHRCMEHGKRYAMFKCDSCCNIATFDCISNHYCEDCHRRPGAKKFIPCPGEGKCPLGMPHPANHTAMHGRERTMGFVLGCFKCFDPNYEPLHYYSSGPDPFKDLEQDNNKGQKFEQLFSYKKQAVCPVAKEPEKIDIIPQAPEPEIAAAEPVIAVAEPVIPVEPVGFQDDEPDDEEEDSAENVAYDNFLQQFPLYGSSDDESESLEEDLDLQRQNMLPNISNVSDDTFNGLRFMAGFYQSESEDEFEVMEPMNLLAPPQMVPVVS